MTGLSQVETAVEKFLDRVYEEDPLYINEVRDLVSFCHYLPDIMSNYGLRSDGFVCRQRYSEVAMTVKVSEGGVPLVAFTTSSTTTSCMQVFLRALRAERVRWLRDKYPWN
jgi:hypothetical protein